MDDAPRITLVTRPGCHLCDEARDVVKAVSAASAASWVELSVDDDAELLARFGEEVPVVLVDGSRHAYWHVDADRLRAALAPRRPRWRRC